MDIITNLPAQEAADIALKNRLYVSGWGLIWTLKQVRDNNMNACVALCEKDGRYVGVSIRIRGRGKSHWNIAVFVRKAERNKGIGTKLVGAIKDDTCSAGYGVVGSENFWDKNNVSWHY